VGAEVGLASEEFRAFVIGRECVKKGKQGDRCRNRKETQIKYLIILWT
jgi:hypothetical protein